MTEYTYEEFFDKQLYQLSQVRDRVNPKIAELDTQIKALETQKKALQSEIDDEERATRDYALQFANAAGTTELHPDITVRRTTKRVYDDDQALAWLEANNHDNLIRVKKSIDKRKFDKQMDSIGFSDYETVNTPTVAIPKALGHIVIKITEL